MSVSPLRASEMSKGYDDQKRAIVKNISNVYLSIVTVCSEVNIVEEFRRWQNKEALFVGIT